MNQEVVSAGNAVVGEANGKDVRVENGASETAVMQRPDGAQTGEKQQSARAGVAIIGYGTAGVNAIIGLRNAGYDGPIRVFSDTDLPPYSPIMTSYYIGGEKTYEECFPWSETQLATLDFELLRNSPVVELDVASHIVRTEQASYSYEKCIIATGSQPSLAGFPAVAGYEPLVLRTMADAVRFKEAIEADACQRVLISGASMIALKSLEACLRHGLDVTVAGMNLHVLDYSALPAAAERFERGLLAKGAHLRLGQTVASVEVAQEPAVAGAKLVVTFSNGDVEAFDEIVVAHGVRVDVGFVAEGALEADRALLVDEFMRTSNADVYAAGDVAQAYEPLSGEKRAMGIWKTAALQGACAGAAVAAELAGAKPAASIAYKGEIPANTIAVDGTLFISGGSIEDGENRRVELRETQDMTVISVFEEDPDGKRRLVGFNVACDKDEAGGLAYDTGAMLTLRIEAACRA